ncbi:PIN domain-containing protein [Streptomyces griseosporeus]|uniref:PIN domain-containing protein n=1 Tax=Streptomyces griseosporeus TaxID=1910 RepID=UPI0036F567AF
MLITPRPGAHRNNLRQALASVHTSALNLQGRTYTIAYKRLLDYLEWATESARLLRSQISERDIDRLVFTPRYQALLASCGTLAGSQQEGLVNGLVDLEVTERIEALEQVIEAFDKQVLRWSGREWLVVADSSFYIQNPEPLKDVDLHEVLGLPSGEHIRLLFPMVVVDELDGMKESGKQRARWRAPHTLGLLDEVLAGSTQGILRRAQLDDGSGQVRGEVSVEIVLDPPGHVRLPIADDEIVDRAVTFQALAGRQVRLLTCDTGQHTRGRAAGLDVTKVATKDPGPEPDWDAQNKPGNGTRARRRERQAGLEEV